MCDCNHTPPTGTPSPVARGRPRKTPEQLIAKATSTTEVNKRQEHNEKMKQYYRDNREAILLKRKEKKRAQREKNNAQPAVN